MPYFNPPELKKIDKLVLNAFIGPLILTFLVIIFILLSKQMLYYFDDIIGKGLGLKILTQFFVYFSILMLPAAMPLSILLASLITFGNLAEHFELTAIKASGLSLLRVLQPIFFLVLLLTGIALYANNFLVPRKLATRWSAGAEKSIEALRKARRERTLASVEEAQAARDRSLLPA